MSDLTVLPVTVEHHREPLGIGETTPRLSWVIAHRPARLAAGRLRAGDRAGRTARSGRPAASSRPSPCSCRGARRRWPAASAAPCACASGARAPPSRRRGARTSSSRPGCSSRRTGRPSSPSRCCRSPEAPGSRWPCSAASSCSTSPSSAPGCTPPRRGSTRPRSTAPSSATTSSRPGWTSYRHRLRYQTYDVTALLGRGRATPSASRSPTAGTAATSGSPAGGTSTATGPAPSPSSRSTTPTGPARSSRPTARGGRRLGPVTRADIYKGETVDFRRELTGWSDAGFRRRRLDAGASSGRSTRPTLVAPTGPPVRRIETAPGAGDLHLAVGRDAGRLRPEPGRPDPLHAARRAGRHRDHHPPRRGARSTASSASGRCARPTRPT